jgi:predicted lipoprotein with Yx(FWY)xxD motif
MYRALPAIFALLAADAAAAQETIRVEVSESEEYGEFLTVAGYPVYLFSSDRPGDEAAPPTISCVGDCLSAWPPVAGDAFEAGAGVDPALLGEIEAEGVAMATYDGWPLYFFARDAEGGPPTGQEIESFGGVWHLIRPDGTRIEGEGV